MGNLVFQATLGGQVNLVGPNTASTFNLNVPAVAGTLVTTGDTGTVTNTMCATSVYTAPGTIGSGTPNSGAFTTLSASSTTTLSGGTANGVAYLNGSKVVTTGSALVFDGANLGLGVTPSGNFLLEAGTTTAAGRSFKLMTLTGGFSGGNYPFFGYNFRSTTTSGTYRYDGNDVASAINFASGIAFNIATSGTAGNAITWNQAMTLDASGNWLLGQTSAIYSAAGRASAEINGSLTAIYAMNIANSNAGYVYHDGTNMSVLNYKNGALVFATNNTERARIDSSGNLLVGQTTASQTTVGSFMKPNGEFSGCQSASTNGGGTQWNTYSTGAGAYRFYVGMGGTVYATSTTITGLSDQRLKENIRDLDEGLDTVMALRPRKFDWKEGKGADIKNARGFIAQEFETVLPDMIDEWKDPAPEGEEPYKSVNANLIPTLVKAIQEQQAIIETLTARITALEQA